MRIRTELALHADPEGYQLHTEVVAAGVRTFRGVGVEAKSGVLHGGGEVCIGSVVGVADVQEAIMDGQELVEGGRVEDVAPVGAAHLEEFQAGGGREVLVDKVIASLRLGVVWHPQLLPSAHHRLLQWICDRARALDANVVLLQPKM